jgi:hypothetical protein
MTQFVHGKEAALLVTRRYMYIHQITYLLNVGLPAVPVEG